MNDERQQGVQARIIELNKHIGIMEELAALHFVNKTYYDAIVDAINLMKMKRRELHASIGNWL